jgi:hypothetical protein
MEMPPISKLGSLLWLIGSYHTPIEALEPLILHEPLKAYDSNNNCFGLEVLPVGPSGDAPSDFKVIEVSSLAVPRMQLKYTTFDQSNAVKIIDSEHTWGGMWGGFQITNFWSPSPNLYTSDGKSCNTISLQEAEKIASSLDFLNP